MSFRHVALIGFGEVGQILAEDLASRAEIAVWDTAFADPKSVPVRAMAQMLGCQGAGSAGRPPSHLACAASAVDAAHDADLIISAVTAAQDLEAARSVQGAVKPGAIFLDLNSCSPGQKVASAEAVSTAGGRYVEAAVMSPFPPKRMAAPMLLGGPHAADALGGLQALGFAGARFYSDVIGRAAATKLCRSVMIKGVEALLTESMLAARHYGVEDEVLSSLSDLLPIPSWPTTAQYMISRSLEHGTRRAEEMREAARTVEEAGVEPLMSRSIAERQDWAADFKPALSADLKAMLDAVIAEMDAP
jgi:3-hydroxyisobutyrate dehydrogenase-like beta-hydroxyacid dehydrogenase